MKKKYQAKCPDGTVLTRGTDRTYSHMLAIKRADGTFGSFGWIGRPDLVEAKKREAERMGYKPEQMMVLPVEEVGKKTNGGHTDDEVSTAIRDYEKEHDL